MNYQIIKLNTARNALRYVIKAFNINEIFIPYYICPAIRNAIKKEKCKSIYYHIDKNFRPKVKFPKNAFVLYPNYFGVCSNIVSELAQEYENLIIDNAHSFYSEPLGIASFNSLRKFFSTLRNGSFLYTIKTLDFNFEVDEFEYEAEKLNFEDICKNENKLDVESIKLISKSTIEIFENLDIELEKHRRIKKFKEYKNELSFDFKISEDDVPFSFPYMAKSLEDANVLVKTLENNNIRIYRYWNNLPDNFTEKIFYTKLISIPL